MIKWNAFVDPDGRAYDMAHLHPTVVNVPMPATITRPARMAVVNAFFGLHCFTRAPKDGEPAAPGMIYFKNAEGRLFCPIRWQHSQAIPGILASIADRKCWFTEKRNHVLFAAIEGDQERYALFFVVSRAQVGAGWDANLNVISAHARPEFRPGGKPIKFRDILRTKL